MSEIITPVVTVFNEDEKLDFEGNRQVIDFLIKNGVDGIYIAP
ncbi:dihydrodipicolinate synthase family protein [Clostridium tyrobutyricum]|nr:dihydrodipicolinate synthase family protein [Clostridium tyrobutyricum]MEA5008722.1 dihydrodipicolinate synthase family protein [Clostridium tyrobutyricum]